MARRTFSGREVISVLVDFGYVPAHRTGSHIRLRYENDEITIGTLRSIADQCGADDFDAWCAWTDRNA